MMTATSTGSSSHRRQLSDIEQQSISSAYDYHSIDNNNDGGDESVGLLSRDSFSSKQHSIQGGLPAFIPQLPGMQIRCHKLDKTMKDGVRLTHCTTQEALSGAKKVGTKHHYWIDIHAIWHPHHHHNQHHQQQQHQQQVCNSTYATPATSPTISTTTTNAAAAAAAPGGGGGRKYYDTTTTTSSSSYQNQQQQHNQHYHPPPYQYYDDSTSVISSNSNSSELRSWLNQLESLPNFVIDMLSDHPDTWASQVIPLPKAILAVIRILPPPINEEDIDDDDDDDAIGFANTRSFSSSSSTNYDDDDDEGMPHLAALCLRNMLITFTSSTSSSTSSSSNSSLNRMSYYYTMVLKRMKQVERLPAPTSRGLFLGWLRFHLDRTSKYTRELRHLVVTMDEAMDRNIENVSLEEIIHVKDQLLRILSVAEEQGECLESLVAATSIVTDTDHNTTTTNGATTTTATTTTTTTSDDFKSLKGSMSILLAKTGATERMALRLEKHIMDLRQRYEGYEHHQMNRRLAVLTVLSAVFLPLTLFTGIWGMNFANMPELNKPYAYPAALMFMLSIAFVMICYFRKTGWFD